MSREETISNLRDMMGGIPFGKSFDGQFDACWVAIKSLEAWDKVIKDATERTVTFIPKSIEGNETYESAFYDGVNYVVDIIKGYLKEVKE